MSAERKHTCVTCQFWKEPRQAVYGLSDETYQKIDADSMQRFAGMDIVRRLCTVEEADEDGQRMSWRAAGETCGEHQPKAEGGR